MKVFWIIIFVFGVLLGYIVSGVFMDKENDSFYVTLPIVAAGDNVGMMGNATFNLVPGSSRVLFDSNPAIDTDMQYSMIIALAYAEQYTGKTLNDSDIVIDLEMPMDVLGGVSAGAPLTVGMIALLEEKQINNSIVLTGTINPDGTIGRVGEIREKAMISADKGYEMILVPRGQSRMWNQSITLQEYLNNTIIVKEVSNIEQAVELMVLE